MVPSLCTATAAAYYNQTITATNYHIWFSSNDLKIITHCLWDRSLEYRAHTTIQSRYPGEYPRPIYLVDNLQIFSLFWKAFLLFPVLTDTLAILWSKMAIFKCTNLDTRCPKILHTSSTLHTSQMPQGRKWLPESGWAIAPPPPLPSPHHLRPMNDIIY